MPMVTAAVAASCASMVSSGITMAGKGADALARKDELPLLLEDGVRVANEAKRVQLVAKCADLRTTEVDGLKEKTKRLVDQTKAIKEQLTRSSGKFDAMRQASQLDAANKHSESYKTLMVEVKDLYRNIKKETKYVRYENNVQDKINGCGPRVTRTKMATIEQTQVTTSNVLADQMCQLREFSSQSAAIMQASLKEMHQMQGILEKGSEGLKLVSDKVGLINQRLSETEHRLSQTEHTLVKTDRRLDDVVLLQNSLAERIQVLEGESSGSLTSSLDVAEFSSDDEMASPRWPTRFSSIGLFALPLPASGG